jgi:tetratricopeptide (TPR) repeat protein
VEAHFAFYYGDYRQARDLGLEALRLQGDSLCLLNLIGKSLLKLGDYQAAMKVFEKAHSISQMNIENLCLLAIAQFESGKKQESDASMQRARELDEGSPLIGETACQIALLSGESSKARSLMENLDSVHAVLAYMNNRAVALTRSGRFDEGIKLYQRTCEAIPATHADARDAVVYNLGLAYARYGELKQVVASLDEILRRKESKVHRKSLSLMKRVKSAIEQNMPLSFYETIVDQEAAAEPAREHARITVALEGFGGYICLNGIYRLPSDEHDQWNSLFDNYPSFVDKSDKRVVMMDQERL